jgi:hypothetical protein
MKEGAVEAEILDWTESLTECGRRRGLSDGNMRIEWRHYLNPD